MSLMSMTGFARAAGSHGPWRFAFELRSVNGRGLDLRLRVPNGMEALDAAIRTRAGQVLARGSVNINLQISRSERGVSYRIDTDLLDRLMDTVRARGAAEGFAPTSVGELMAVRGVVEASEQESGEDEQAGLVGAAMATFEEALKGLVEARRAEGKVLTAVLSGQIDRIAELTEAAETHPERSLEAIRSRLSDQLAALAGQPGIDPARLHGEAVLLATRADIREELDRLKAHVGQARDMIGKGGVIGRKLDFLAQEFNRESNTLCSKSNHVQLTAIGLELKTVVDQLKEQVQNIE